MEVFVWSNTPFCSLLNPPPLRLCKSHAHILSFPTRWHSLSFKGSSTNKRECLFTDNRPLTLSRILVSSCKGDPRDTTSTGSNEDENEFPSYQSDVEEISEDELLETRIAGLREAKTILETIKKYKCRYKYPSDKVQIMDIGENELQDTITALCHAQAIIDTIKNEKERPWFLEELALFGQKQMDYVSEIEDDAREAFWKAVSLFKQKLDDSLEKFSLVPAKQNAVEDAVRVLKLAEVVFQQTLSHIFEYAKRRISAAETAAAKALYQIEKQIRNATESTILSVAEHLEQPIHMDRARPGQIHYSVYRLLFENDAAIAAIRSRSNKLQDAVSDFESQLPKGKGYYWFLMKLEQARTPTNASELRASFAKSALFDMLELVRVRPSLYWEGKVENIQRQEAEDIQLSIKQFMAKLEGIKANVEATQEFVCMKHKDYMRSCEALHSLRGTTEDELPVGLLPTQELPLSSKENIEEEFPDPQFSEGSMVMIDKGQYMYFPPSYRRLNSSSSGPFKIIRKIGDSAYILDLPEEKGNSRVFNEVDLTPYQGYHEDCDYQCYPIGDTISQVAANRGHSFLIEWEGRHRYERTWITDEEFQLIDRDLYDRYMSHQVGKSKGD